MFENIEIGQVKDLESKRFVEEEALKEQTKADKNRDFVQVYPLGWRRLQYLMKHRPQAARIYALMAEHMDASTGAVVVSQIVLAEMLGIAEITVRRQTKWMHDNGIFTRIRVGSGVYAYALNPDEVWRSWRSKKDYAAFRTKTLVKKSDAENRIIDRKLQMMIKEHRGEPELPFLEDEGESS